jgi:hypothetical protein
VGRQLQPRLYLDVAQNAFDFLLDAAERAAAGGMRDYKYAILHLSAAVELLLKARLEQEHWSLLFADTDKATPAALQSGNFRSVDFDVARRRLENICGVLVDDSATKNLRNIRNQIEHFRVDIEAPQVKSLLATGISFFLDFCRRELPDVLAQIDSGEMDRLIAFLREFEDFVRERLLAIQPELAAATSVWTCPRCRQEALILGDADPHCAFCTSTMSPEFVKTNLGEGPADGICLSCGSDNLCIVLFNNEDGVCVCTSCGSTQRVCLACGNHFFGEGDWCSTCLEETGGDEEQLRRRLERRFRVVVRRRPGEDD